jgi:PKD repeat protein
MLRRHALLLVLGLAVCAGTAQAAAAPRPFSPVQDGPVADAPALTPWIPGRLLVKFTADALRASDLDRPLAKAAGARTSTGLAAVDRMLAAATVASIRPAHGACADAALARQLGVDRWYRVDVAEQTDIADLAARLARDPNLEYALPDLRAFPAVVPNDPLYADNWGHDNTAQLPDLDWGGTYAHDLPTTVGTVGFDANADLAWNGSQGYGSSGVVIAILDSGVDAGHPDLLQVAGYDFGDNDGDPDDDSAAPGHGTACAGVAAAIAGNGLGAVGVAGGSSIMPLKVSDSAGNLAFSYIIDALYHAADNGADIASMSFGASGVFSYQPFDDAAAYAAAQGVTMLAATGNSNAGTIEFPAYNPNVIGVGAASPCDGRKRSSSDSGEVNPGVSTDPNGFTCDGERWWGSSYGASIQDHQGAVDVLAPTILPTTDIQGSGGYDPGDYSGFFNGTSCATPYAAGVCALIKAANPSWTPAQIRSQLVGTAQDVVNIESGAGWDRYSGYGLVDAAAAVGAGAAAPVAVFGLDTGSGCAPLAVAFTDLSTGDIDTWDWDFGDGGTSTLQDPGHAYASPGVYDVSLTVSGPGGSDTATTVGLVTVTGPPAAAFDAAPTVITAGATVTFTDTSSGAPTAWTWDFGDGGSAGSQNPDHTYTVPGVYAVRLIAANACGPDTLTVPDLVTVNAPPPPVADFTADNALGCGPLTVAFTDLSSGQIDTWAWDFGDGGTSALQNPSHEYTLPGGYSVQLVVTGLGGADTLWVPGAALVLDQPVASFNASPTDLTAGESVFFTDTSAGTPLTWDWDFGDGGTSTLANPEHLYAVPGTYTVTLVVTNTCGADTLVAVDHVGVAAPPQPTALFTVDPASGCAPLAVSFTDASTGGFDSWSWDFGDGGVETVQNPQHVFTDPGSYTVRLAVSGVGGVDTLTVPDAVVVALPVAAAFALSDTLGQPGLAVTFNDLSAGDPTSWSWDFGDAGTDSVAAPVHVYAAEGIYDVTLIVANACSADTLTMVAAVQTSALSAAGAPVPARFALAPAYPNPFNPSTTIVYGLARAGHARLEVFDVSGRRVAVLVDGNKGAGEHRQQWRPQGLASGVYFARLTAHGNTATQRLTLLK